MLARAEPYTYVGNATVRHGPAWAVRSIAMRALRETDAFPAADVGLLRAMADESGQRPTPATLLDRAEAWRPWRAYAAIHLWASLPAPMTASTEELEIQNEPRAA